MGKLYLCRHHVRFADFTAIPGEVVEAELTEAAEKRLLALGALEDDKKPSACIGCRACEAVCPQQIKISEMMKDFAEKTSL